ncbi:MAG: hypothetical protein ABSF46_16225 [Terriglobia bacterium]
MSNPKKTRLIADACLKNDRVDTEELLHSLRLGYLPRVWIPLRACATGRNCSAIEHCW